jgi:hypothetical protein
MAELVDALVSGTSIRKDVQVRVLFRAQETSIFYWFFSFQIIFGQIPIAPYFALNGF